MAGDADTTLPDHGPDMDVTNEAVADPEESLGDPSESVEDTNRGIASPNEELHLPNKFSSNGLSTSQSPIQEGHPG